MASSNHSSFHELLSQDLQHIELPAFATNSNFQLLLFTSASALLVSIVAAAAVFWRSRDPLAGIPLIGQEGGDEKKRRERFVTEAKRIYLEGYEKFKDDVYQITTVRRSRTIVVAPKYLDELRKLPDDVVCNQCAADETLESHYTKLNTHEPLHGHVMKTLLTPNLRRLNPRIAHTIAAAVRSVLPPSSTSSPPSSDSWSPVNPTDALLHIVAAATGAVGVGAPLCSDPTYLAASVRYSRAVMRAMAAASHVPKWCRRVVAPWLGEVRELDGAIAGVERIVGGLVAERRERGRGRGSEEEGGAGDFLQWTMENAERFGLRGVREVVRAYLGFNFAAVHSTTVVATNVLFNIAAMPEFTAELREEIASVLARNDGVMTFQALQEMMKLDSFMKETLRLYPLQFANFQRKVLKPFALAGTGTVIPANTVIEVPSMAVSLDPAVFPDPHRFDPLRFYNLRTATTPAAAADQKNHHQFASVSADSLNFGWGRHACPGRFFAANEIKMVVASVLLEWDVRMPDAKDGEGEWEREWQGRRWRNWEYGNFCFPVPTRELLFRKITA